MKPGIPETGTVIRLEGEHAVVRMQSEISSCGKCGVAAAGLCHGGMMKVLTVRNPQRAAVGDTVKIGLVRGVKYRGYLLAYVIPVAALVLGAAGGHLLGSHAGIPGLDVLAGFASLIAALFFSLRRLRHLDASSSIEIVNVLCDP
jgi:sigma-E factor negative regulatory protein RseC